MRQLTLAIALVVCTAVWSSQDLWAMRAVVITAKCEVESVDDSFNIMQDRVARGDVFTAELLMLPKTFDSQGGGASRTLLMDVRMWNQEVEIDYVSGAPAVNGQGVEEVERTNGQCLNRLWMGLINNYLAEEEAPFLNPNFSVYWENSECYGADEFEAPTEIDIDDWSLERIEFVKLVGRFSPRRIGIQVKVVEYEITEFSGGAVSIRAFEDENLNCRYDAGEKPVTPLTLDVNGSPENTVSFNQDGFGYLSTRENSVSLTVAEVSNDWMLSCGAGTVEYEFGDDAPDIIDVPLRRVDAPGRQAAVLVGADAARPGKLQQYRLFVTNPTNGPLSGQLNFNFDEVLRLQNTRPVASSSGPNSAVWDLAELEPGARKIIIVDMQLTNDPLLQGDQLCAEATITANGGVEIGSDVYCQTIVGDLEQVRLARLKRERDAAQSGNVEADEEVEFMLHINNFDARPVRSMRITVPFHAGFIDGSWAPLAASHPYTFEQTDDGATEFVFENVNLAAAHAAGQGGMAFLRLSAQLRADLPDGYYLENHVRVEFEYAAVPDQPLPAAEVLLSNTVTSRVGAVVSSVEGQEDGSLQLRVFPNPSTEMLNIEHPNLTGAQVHVHDQLGRRVAHFRSAGESLRIDTDGLAVGLYVLRIEFRSGELETVRFGLVR